MDADAREEDPASSQQLGHTGPFKDRPHIYPKPAPSVEVLRRIGGCASDTQRSGMICLPSQTPPFDRARRTWPYRAHSCEKHIPDAPISLSHTCTRIWTHQNLACLWIGNSLLELAKDVLARELSEDGSQSVEIPVVIIEELPGLMAPRSGRSTFMLSASPAASW